MNHRPFLWLFSLLAILSLVPGTLTAIPPVTTHETNPELVDLDPLLASLEGAWAGGEKVNRTPFGPIPFALLFEKQPDGSLEALTSMSRSTWVKLRFHQDANREWLLTESAGLEGLGVQSHTMRLVSATHDTAEWATKDPSFMSCTLAAKDQRLTVLVIIRGEEHIFFSLERLSNEEEISELRQELLEAAQRDGNQDPQRLTVTGESIDEGDPSSIAYARAEVAARPDHAPTQMQLASALREHLNTAPPMKMIAYASELLKAMQTAANLDPKYVAAHYGLAQYYLNAPPIAGGSLVKAREKAEVLTQLGSPLAEIVLALAAAKEGDPAAAETRLKKLLEEHPDLTEATDLLREFTDRGTP